MGVLSGMVWSQLTELPHPVIQAQRCINQYRRRNCSACGDICPEQVLEPGGKVKSWSACTDCQRCVSACPTRAIGMSEQRLNQMLSLRTGQEERLWLGCEASQRDNDLHLGCLCELSWEALAYLSFFRRLVLDLEPCERCQHDECRTLLGKQLQQLHFFLGEERFRQRVLLVYDEKTEPKPQQELTRRDLFQHGAALSKSGVESLLRQAPLMSSEELKLDGLSLRSLLHKQMEQSGAVFHWTIPKTTGECVGCGCCVKSCPTQALRFSEDGKWLVLDTLRCVGCGSCSIVCTKKRINGVETVGVRGFTPVALAAVHKPVCRLCGKEMKAVTANGLCPACQQKRIAEAARRNRRGREE